MQHERRDPPGDPAGSAVRSPGGQADRHSSVVVLKKVSRLPI